MSLARKKVVVIGGSSGIGLATAELAKREGADVVVASRNAERLGALESLTKGLALELAPVRVNAVSPGTIDTPIRASMAEAARRDMLAKTAASLPVGRVGVSEDIAQQILAFMAIGFATGSVVYIDGGALLV